MIIQTDKPLAKRNAHDFYPTPRYICDRALDLLDWNWKDSVDYKPFILDPGCGTGVWGQAALARWPQATVDGVEIRDVPLPTGYRYIFRGDFRLQDTGLDYDLVIGNPPFAFAEQFVRVGLANLKLHGYLLYLLPLQFLEGEKRRTGLFRHLPPREVHIAGRVSFTGNGKSDNTPYAIYIWQQGWVGTPSLKWMKQGKGK